MWWRLVGEGLTRALQHYHVSTDAPTHSAVPSLAIAAAEHSLHTEVAYQQLQQQVAGLRAHSEQVEARCEELGQEVVGLQDLVAAMIASNAALPQVQLQLGQQMLQQLAQQHAETLQQILAAQQRAAEVAELRATVTAMGAQLQSLVEQQRERQ